MNSTQPPQEKLDDLLEYYQNGKYVDAEKLSLTITQEFPDHQFAWKVLAVVLQQTGRIKDSLFACQKSKDLEPQDSSAHNNLGNALKELGKLEEAEKSYRKAIELKLDFVEAHYNLGNVLKGLGRFEEAEKSYRKAIEFKHDFVEGYHNLANVLKESNKFVEAETNYKKAIELKPDHKDVHYNFGVMLNNNKDYKKAIDHFKLTDSAMSKSFLLNALYQLDEKDNFYDHLDFLIKNGYNNALIGSLISRSQIRYKNKKPNPFCNEPLNYVLTTDLLQNNKLEDIYLNDVSKILSDNKILHKSQNLLTNGIQTLGNIFDQLNNQGKEVKNIIYSEIEKYRFHFKDSKEGFLINWPKNYKVNGWLISMKKGGSLSPHIHEYGWVSGSIYLNVPKKINNNDGNLVVGLDPQMHESIANKKSINVVNGNLCLFPSSLYHCTIPFESEENRIVLAFDVIPDL